MFQWNKVMVRNEKGFSLVELMIVVAIIGILAGLAVPKFQTFQAKAKQSEAKNNLSHVYTLQQSYFGDNDTYVTFGIIGRNAAATCNHDGATPAANILGFRPVGPCGKVRYGYTGTVGSASAFTATAASYANLIVSGCTTTDTWSVNQDKAITATTDAVATCN